MRDKDTWGDDNILAAVSAVLQTQIILLSEQMIFENVFGQHAINIHLAHVNGNHFVALKADNVGNISKGKEHNISSPTLEMLINKNETEREMMTDNTYLGRKRNVCADVTVAIKACADHIIIEACHESTTIKYKQKSC